MTPAAIAQAVREDILALLSNPRPIDPEATEPAWDAMSRDQKRASLSEEPLAEVIELALDNEAQAEFWRAKCWRLELRAKVA